MRRAYLNLALASEVSGLILVHFSSENRRHPILSGDNEGVPWGFSYVKRSSDNIFTGEDTIPWNGIFIPCITRDINYCTSRNLSEVCPLSSPRGPPGGTRGPRWNGGSHGKHTERHLVCSVPISRQGTKTRPRILNATQISTPYRLPRPPIYLLGTCPRTVTDTLRKAHLLRTETNSCCPLKRDSRRKGEGAALPSAHLLRIEQSGPSTARHTRSSTSIARQGGEPWRSCSAPCWGWCSASASSWRSRASRIPAPSSAASWYA